MRLLLVEDNATNALIGARVLRKHQFLVDLATNGKEALDKYCSNPDLYKLILMVSFNISIFPSLPSHDST